MELELYKEKIEGMNLIFETQVTQEEVCEAIIPDSQPDILKVMETSVNVLLKSKEAEQGRAIVKGVLQSTVIYAAEDDNFYKVEIPIPYTVIANCHDINDDYAVLAVTDILSADAFISNSRKIVVKANYITNIHVFGNYTVEFCCKVENDDVYQLIDEVHIPFLNEYKEKTFVISDDIALENSDGCNFEILSAEFSVKNVDYSISGSRILIRGTAETNLTLLFSDRIVPEKFIKKSDFSQILDTDASELDNIKINIMLTGCYCDAAMHSAENDMQSVSIELHAVAQCEIYKKKETTVMRDLYCVYGDIICTTEEITVFSGDNLKCETIKHHDKFENMLELKEIISAKIQFGEVNIENNTAKFNGTFYAYGIDGNAIPTVFKHNLTFKYKTDVVHVPKIRLLSINTEIISNEINIDLEIELISKEKVTTRFITVNAAEIQENNKWDSAYSAVLCELKENETLWDIAKRNLSSVDIIKKFNNIDSETNIEAGTILLVPKA